ncbi:MAG: redox-sensing transcriptional repressor Rex [Thermomicrobiales bacterium]
MERDLPARDQSIPDIVIRRLPIYRRGLRHLLRHGKLTISSNDLAAEIGVTAAQIRRDLSYFGRFGKQGKGYDVPTLIDAVQQILNIDRRWDVALAGFGHLGQAIADYRGFEPSSFRIAAIFDRSPDLIGTESDHGIEVCSQDDIARVVREKGIRMGIVAVPADQAQEVTDKLLEGGIEAILNYAPVTLRVPEGVWVREIDPISLMQSMTFYLDDDEGEKTNGTGPSRSIADVADS